MAENLRLYACMSTIIRMEPSVMVKRRYETEMITKGMSCDVCHVCNISVYVVPVCLSMSSTTSIIWPPDILKVWMLQSVNLECCSLETNDLGRTT